MAAFTSPPDTCALFNSFFAEASSANTLFSPNKSVLSANFTIPFSASSLYLSINPRVSLAPLCIASAFSYLSFCPQNLLQLAANLPLPVPPEAFAPLI